MTTPADRDAPQHLDDLLERALAYVESSSPIVSSRIHANKLREEIKEAIRELRAVASVGTQAPEPSELSDERLWAFGGAVASAYSHEYAQSLRDGVTEQEAYARTCARLRELLCAVVARGALPAGPPDALDALRQRAEDAELALTECADALAVVRALASPNEASIKRLTYAIREYVARWFPLPAVASEPLQAVVRAWWEERERAAPGPVGDAREKGSGVRPGDLMHSPDPRTGQPRRWAKMSHALDDAALAKAYPAYLWGSGYDYQEGVRAAIRAYLGAARVPVRGADTYPTEDAYLAVCRANGAKRDLIMAALSVDGVNEDDAPERFGDVAATAWVCGYEAGQSSICEVLRTPPDNHPDAAYASPAGLEPKLGTPVELPLQGSNLDSPDPESGKSDDRVG